ncbi:hypothetical protein H4R34_005059 [Dimargaris verticillata]|uniref:Succinate dehydrogenase assembly factor 4, mitochondrial n=1 Tax=Dimargaris verticillata TaxID=2761393 RepID=A0A9W8B4B6_9FUNG|nr:hypothetical protein H4R34_005059 [Dimargaris verticillata]
MPLPTSRITLSALVRRAHVPRRLFTSFRDRPGPVPLGDKQQQKEFEAAIQQGLQNEAAAEAGQHPAVVAQPTLQPFENDINPDTHEQGGPKGPEPTRYGDWERNGRVIDF